LGFGCAVIRQTKKTTHSKLTRFIEHREAFLTEKVMMRTQPTRHCARPAGFYTEVGNVNVGGKFPCVLPHEDFVFVDGANNNKYMRK